MDIQKHYKSLFEKYGDSHKSSQWADRESQEKRFQYLLEIADIKQLEGKKLLDFGCGTGHLATYLTEQNIDVQYIGIDIVPELLECAKVKHPESRFYSVDEIPDEKYDYIIISVVFNNKMEDNVTFFQDTIKNLVERCEKGIAFNMLSHYVDYYDDNLFYFKPEEVFCFLKENISPYIAIRNEYQLKPNTIPFEFTTYIYMK
ncbi:MAG: class I SAM-dependent methyltransferase [Lysinibacillus fusiformis]|nr:class I SAM-dependent methyltransferase [Lysinibacillus fusiformis]